MSKFADLHCHPGLHPFAYDYAGKKRNENVWDYDPPKPRQRRRQFPEYTQSDFRTLAKGGVKLAYVSIYPIEQGWFRPKYIGEGGFADILARLISKLPIKFVNAVQSDSFRYYDFFVKEYHYLNKENTMPHEVDKKIWRYTIVRPGDDIDEILSRENTIGVILTVEGAQSLIPAGADTINRNEFDLEQTLINIEAVKTWEYPPFFVSLSHHFYNGLCGHARSFPGVASKVLDQNLGMNAQLNANGWEVIECLLGLNEYEGNGQRILIDTKHMSISARKDYYELIRGYNVGREDPDKIPIVVSHTAYSGHATMDDAASEFDSDDKYESSNTFNNWSINLCDDEILEIFNSNGIIGLNFDERILSGHAVKEEYKERFPKKKIKDRSDELQEFWAKQMLNNLLEIVKVVVNSGEVPESEKVKAWNMLSIGTDFDGLINAEDAFITAQEFKDFRTNLKKIFDQEDFSHLMQGLTVEQVLDKIMYTNAVDFARMYYVKP